MLIDLYAIQCSLQSLFIMDQDDVLHAIYMFHNFHLIGFYSSNNQGAQPRLNS